MALSILDGNQSATTLSTIVTSGQHIPAHTVVSIGTQAITDISGAISGSTVCVGNLGLLQSTVATEGLSASGSFILPNTYCWFPFIHVSLAFRFKTSS